jgi:hypothetical protein
VHAPDGSLALLLGNVLVFLGEFVGGALALYDALALGAQRLGGGDLLVPLLLELLDLLLDLPAKHVDVVGPLLAVHPRHYGRGEVQDPIEVLGADVQEVAHTARHALDEPDVSDRSGQLDMTHAVPADPGAGHLDAAALADDALEPDPLVLAAVALPVLGRTEDALVEEPVLLRT